MTTLRRHAMSSASRSRATGEKKLQEGRGDACLCVGMTPPGPRQTHREKCGKVTEDASSVSRSSIMNSQRAELGGSSTPSDEATVHIADQVSVSSRTSAQDALPRTQWTDPTDVDPSMFCPSDCSERWSSIHVRACSSTPATSSRQSGARGVCELSQTASSPERASRRLCLVDESINSRMVPPQQAAVGCVSMTFSEWLLAAHRLPKNSRRPDTTERNSGIRQE